MPYLPDGRYQIEHSGQVWTSLGRGRFAPIWPVEELFARRKFKQTVQDRIRKMNPNGLEEGSMIRGFFPKPMSYRRAKIKLARGQHPYRFRRKGNRGIWDAWYYHAMPPEMR